MPKKEKKKTIEGQILAKLENMEKRFDERISEVESSLKRIEESSVLTTDDQLFFGIVFALLILFLQLPEFDVCTIFESFGVIVEPTKGILTTKMVLIIFLLFSTGARYLTTLIKKDKERNKWRMVSVGFLLGCFYYLIVELTIRGLATVLKNINVFLILLSPVTLSVISIAIGFFVEKRWYRVYGYEHTNVSLVVGYLGVAILIAYYLAMVTSLFIPISELVSLIILLSSVFITYLTNKLSFFLYERLKHIRNEKEGK